ncbi:MAG: hypothetical protein SFU86_13050 [Pirellulaceae bacterium]|nr:hypothetical protein [Pirellulaceae bacterium]
MLSRIARFVLPPLILVVAFVGYRLAVVRPTSDRIVATRNEPWKITPRYNEPRVITDEQLAEVLDRVKPIAKPVKTNDFVHALRLWGAEADFRSPSIPTGQELRDYILSDEVFQKFAGPNIPPLLYRDQDGLAVRSYDDHRTNRDTSSYHADDLLATLAETGTPLDAKIKLRDGSEATVADLLNDSLRRFHLERLEYEWGIISYARYLFPLKAFRNKFGERITVEQLVDEAITPRLELGPCNGLHRLEALAVLNRADEEAHALRPRTRLAVLTHLKRVSQLLTESQTSDGYWTRNWPEGAAAATPTKEQAGELYDRILVTGHHLEWLALAPDEVQPPRETIVRASQWLTRALLEMDQKDLQAAYGPYSHAARALALWRGQEPFAAWQAGQKKEVGMVDRTTTK